MAERVAPLEVKMDMVLENVKDIKQNMVTKPEVAALDRRVTSLEEKEKNSKAHTISTISAIAAVASVLVAIWAVANR